MTQATKEVHAAEVPPVAPSLRMHTFPGVAMKLAFGAVTEPMKGGVKLAFEGDVFVLNASDHEIIERVAARLREEVPKEVTASKFIELYGLAQKYVAEEVFRPGTIRVLYYPSLTPASAFYRCQLPTVYLNRGDKVSAHVSAHLSARDAQWCDVVVIQLDHSAATRKFARTLKGMGKKVVFEFDDHFGAIDPHHPQYEKYRLVETQKEIDEMMELCDAVTVTTDALKHAYSKRTRTPIKVIPNSIPLDDWPKAEPHGTSDFRILWAGSPSHFGDLGIVSEALWGFLRDHREAKAVFFGRPPEGIPADLTDRIHLIPFTDFSGYPAKLAEISADVAIAPLADNEFNRAKSDLKLLEYGACGYPVIASNTGPYREAANNAAPTPPCVMAWDTPSWKGALENLYFNPPSRKLMAHNALEYARGRSAAVMTPLLERFFAGL